MDNDLSISDIIRGLKYRDEEIFSKIFARYYANMVVFAFKIIDNEVVAEDIAIESLTKMLNRTKPLQDLIHFESSLFLTVRRSCINHILKIKRKVKHDIQYPQQLDEVDCTNIELDDSLYEKLYQAIESLPNQSKKIIRYIYIEKLSYQRISELMNTSIKNIENIRAYALKKLRIDFNV